MQQGEKMVLAGSMVETSFKANGLVADRTTAARLGLELSCPSGRPDAKEPTASVRLGQGGKIRRLEITVIAEASQVLRDVERIVKSVYLHSLITTSGL